MTPLEEAGRKGNSQMIALREKYVCEQNSR